jgi:CO/xanthine dehydrogenase FAD-binding subunit
MGSYLRPTGLADALAALAARTRTVLAGGTDHYPARVVHTPDEDILDITALPGLRTIEAHATHWRIPALVTWTDLLEAELPPLFDGLRDAAHQIGGVQVQNRGTLIGNLCNASPAADGIPNLLALDAVVELVSAGGGRLVPVADFVVGNRRTVRRPDELAIAIRIPRPQRPACAVFRKLGARRYLVISIVMVAAVLAFDPDGRVTEARVAVGACGPAARRLPALEAALVGHTPSPERVHPGHLAPLTPIDDFRGSAAYRQAATLELLRRAVAELAMPERIAA